MKRRKRVGVSGRDSEWRKQESRGISPRLSTTTFPQLIFFVRRRAGLRPSGQFLLRLIGEFDDMQA